MTAMAQLPAGFEALQPFASQWAAPTLAGRDAARLSSTPEQRRAFYDAAGGQAAAALDYLNGKPLGAFSAADQMLMNLLLSLIHVTLAVELQRDDEPLHARGARMMPIVRGHADGASSGYRHCEN